MTGPARDGDVTAYLDALGVPGIVDAHVHFMPDRVQQKVWAHFDRLDPPWPVTYRDSPDERLETLTHLGVRHHTALAYAHRPGMLRFLNDHTLALSAAQPQVIPTFTIYPEPGVGDEVNRCLGQGGRCVKVHLQVGGFDANDPLLDDAWARLEEAGTPIVIHAGAVADGSGNEEYCGPAPVRRLAARFPGLRLVVAHMGAPDHDGFVALAEEIGTLWMDTAMVFTSPSYLAAPPDHLRARVAALGDRIVFGSDFPTIPHAFASQVRGLAELDLGDRWMSQVLWHNGVRLFGLDPRPRA
ncbi:MAG: amidohydrolase family protein [Acidimicrobiales bacterium]